MAEERYCPACSTELARSKGRRRGSSYLWCWRCERSWRAGLDEPNPAHCPRCGEEGTYEGRVLIDGRGVYTCPNDHRWQNAEERPSHKGVPLAAHPNTPRAESRADRRESSG